MACGRIRAGGAGRGRAASPRWRVVAALAAAGAVAPPAFAQFDEPAPVYIADAPFAEEALGMVGSLLDRGGADEAVRLIQRVLDEQGDRLIGSDVPGVFVSVRQRAHERVLGDPALLEAYRVRQGPRARALLEEGRWAEVARSSWLTRAGFEASLRAAQMLVESAAFEAGSRVMEELLDHPDAPTGAADGAALSALAATYAGTDRAWTVADRWAALAGRPAPERVSVPAPAGGADWVVRSLDWSSEPGGPADAVSLDGVVPRALHSADITVMEPADPPEPRMSGAQRPELGWTLPTLAGGDLFTNDGLTLTCFDRFTLRPKWRVTDPSGVSEEGTTRQMRTRLGRVIEDSGSVTVSGDRVYAALGVARSGADDSIGRVVCVDRTTGRVLWSVLLGALSEDLRGAEPRGPVVVDGDTVIVGARKNLRSRRLVTLALVGLDAHTGRVRWTRGLGSAGSLPFQQVTQLSEGGTLRDGVVYWSDKIGLVGAVETATGRVLWVRQTRSPGLYTRGVRTPWTTSLPVATDDGLFVLSPDQTEIIRLDPRDGTLLGAAAAEPAGEAAYLLMVGDTLASVGTQRVAFYDPARITDGSLRVTPVLDERGLRGRVVAAGGRLAVPISSGLTLITPEGGAESIPLDATGNIVIDDGQAVVVDEVQVRSFLSWETASAMLERRVASGDLEAALALAELAQRSGREGRVVGAIDDAVRLARADADAPAARDRVFDAVRTLADPASSDTRGRPVSTAVRGELLDRMGAVARTDAQRVAHAMARGAWMASTGDPAGAAAAYQDVLLQPAWSRAIWSGGGLSVRAELEATRRLHELADRHGSRATEMADRMARAEIEGLQAAGGSGAEWETVARRYPASVAAPRAWAGAAAGFHNEGRWPAAERAARSGLRSAVRGVARSQPPEPAQINELAGVLVSSLVNQGRGDEAGEALAEADAQFGAVEPMVGGVPVAVSPGGSERRLPVIGPRVVRADMLTLLPGVPVAGSGALANSGADPALVVMHAGQIGELAAYRSGEIASEGGVDRAIWRQDGVGSVPPVLVHADSRSLVLVWGDELQTGRPARAESRDPATGQLLWEAELRMPIDRIDPGPDPAARLNGQIVSPLEGSVSNSHLLASADGRTLVVADRLGRAAAVDLADGRLLWSRLLGVTRLYGLDLRGGVLGVCGAVAGPNMDEQGFADAGLRGIGEAIDARTGETIQLLDDLGAEARWVRVAPDGQVIVASDTRIVAMDSLAGRIDWSNADEELGASQDAWVLGDTLVVLGADRALWTLSRREGVRSGGPIDTNGRGWDRARVSVERRDFGLVVSGASGVTTHAPDGTLLAADAIESRGFAETATARSRVALVEQARTDASGDSAVDVVIVDARTGRVEDRVTVALPQGVRRIPTRAVAADGVVIIGFNEVSVVLAVPGGDG